MEFKCSYRTWKRQINWNGEIKKLHGNKEQCEFEFNSRGNYYHVIVGKHDYGNYVCIPNWDVGCELADYVDYFWNVERLSKRLKKEDAITVATAIREVKKLL
jgi:hypothetical protein